MRRLALITGASAGLGQAFARIYAAHGWDVALTARRVERLHQVADEVRMKYGVETLVVPADLTDPSAPERVVSEVEAQGRAVDALVNNAGYSNTQGFAPSAWGDHRNFLQTLLLAPAELAHRVLPSMLDRKFGRIINVASIAGLLPATGGDTLYGPTKSFLIKFSQGLHLEVRDRGVHVSALCPGYTYTEFHDINGSRAAVTHAIPQWLWMGAEEVVDAGYEAVEANRPICVPGAPYKTIAALLKALPDDWTLALTAKQGERLGRL